MSRALHELLVGIGIGAGLTVFWNLAVGAFRAWRGRRIKRVRWEE